MTDITSSIQIILQEAGYKTWLVPVEQHTAVCFEDAAVIGFASIFEEPGSLLKSWRSVETTLLTRHAPRFREAEDKAWNVYSIFLCAKSANEDVAREIRCIDEDQERTRKIVACGLASHESIVTALLPILPIQYRPRLEEGDVTERLKKRIASIAPAVTNVALDEDVPPSDVVRLLGGTT
jgi:hypothetical protein